MIIFYRDKKIVYSKSHAPEGVVSGACSPELEAVLSVAELMGWEVDLGNELVNGLEQLKGLTHDEWGVSMVVEGDTIVTKSTSGLLAGMELSRTPLKAPLLVVGLVICENAKKTLEDVVSKIADEIGISPAELVKIAPDMPQLFSEENAVEILLSRLGIS